MESQTTDLLTSIPFTAEFGRSKRSHTFNHPGIKETQVNALTEWLFSSRRELRILLVVSHPDDDAIFAGQLQRQLQRHDWHVVCMTHSANTERGQEMVSWQKTIGTPTRNLTFLSAADDPEDYRQKRCSIDPNAIDGQLRRLNYQPDLVVTHNEIGEYDHPHHVMLHRVTRGVFRQEPFLLFGYGLEQCHVSVSVGEKWDLACRTYKSQKHIIGRFRETTETFAWLQPGVTSSSAT
jgi:LmbE family N-acetylglucosaminyl deacetylase